MILVTGATGFVGSALVADLAARGMPFRAASRLARPGHVAVGEINAGTDWQAALAGVDTVIHLAARVHVMDDRAADPLAAFRASNVDATLNLARQAAAAGVRRLVFVSSIKVNGEATAPGQPYRETDTPRPVDPYGQSKLEAERALFELAGQTSMQIVVVRPPLVYGAGVRANFAALFRLAGRGVPLPFGAVHNRRSMVNVRNLSDFLLTCATHPAAAGEVFLVSDGADVSTAGLLATMAAALQRPSRLIPVPVWLMTGVAGLAGRSAVGQRLFGSLQVSTDKAATLLGWHAPLTLQDGLQDMAEHLRDQSAGLAITPLDKNRV